MSSYLWQRGFDPSGGPTATSLEWDETWIVDGYVQPAGEPSWLGLLADRTDLAIGAAHPTIAASYVAGFSAEQVGEPLDLWTVTIRYKRETSTDRETLPWDRPAKISLEFESIEEPRLTWLDGTPILNTAGSLMTGVTRPRSQPVFMVRKSLQTLPAWLVAYFDLPVNNDAVSVRGLPIAAEYLQLQKLRFGDDETEEVGNATVTSIPLSFALVYNRATWKTKLLNAGLYQLFDGDFIRCADSNFEPADEPQLLAADGSQLLPPVNPAAINVVEGWLFELLPFSVLPLT